MTRFNWQSLETSSKVFFAFAGAITAARIILLAVSGANLGPDEAQYWFWSRTFDFGYFSKPPLIAWVIALTTGLFGNSEWAVRLAAPLFHGGTAVLLYFTGRAAFSPQTGFWAGLTWLAVPGVILSSFVFTTDAPLLFFWSAALFFVLQIMRQSSPPMAAFAFLGIAIGLGMLAKYAMIYFPIALLVVVLTNKSARAKFLSPGGASIFILAAMIVAPNIFWNVSHDFSTLSHTAANANWNGNFFHPVAGASFLLQQFAVAGLVPVAAFIWLCARSASPSSRLKLETRDAALLIFALTPLLVVTAQAFLSRAHANWAAASYPAIILLTTGWLFGRAKGWLVKANAGAYLCASIAFAAALADFGLADRLGLSGATKEIRGWREQARMIANLAEGFDAIVIDDRALMGAMLFYDGESKTEIVAIDPNARVDNHYEAFKAFEPARHKRVLFVTTRDDAAHVDYRFHNIAALGPQTVAIGDKARTYHLFDISGYYGKVPSAR